MFINVDKEGRSTFTDENNKTFKLDTIEDRMRLIKETPNILGAHAGGDWTARRKSHSDFLNFFKSHFFS